MAWRNAWTPRVRAQWMKCTRREVFSAASSIASVGVMPTPPLISTSGRSLSSSVKTPEGG